MKLEVDGIEISDDAGISGNYEISVVRNSLSARTAVSEQFKGQLCVQSFHVLSYLKVSELGSDRTFEGYVFTLITIGKTCYGMDGPSYITGKGNGVFRMKSTWGALCFDVDMSKKSHEMTIELVLADGYGKLPGKKLDEKKFSVYLQD